MEETSDDENYYENFRALSETWDCETSDTDGEDTNRITPIMITSIDKIINTFILKIK